MNSRMTVRRWSQTHRLCLSILSAAATFGATATPASALLFTSQLATSTAEELDALNNVVNQAKAKRARPSRPTPMFSSATA